MFELSPKEKTVLSSFGAPKFSRCAILRNSLKRGDRTLGSIPNPVVIADHHLEGNIIVFVMEIASEVAAHVVVGIQLSQMTTVADS